MFMDVHDDELQLDSSLWRFITCMPALRLQLVHWCNNQAWVQIDKELMRMQLLAEATTRWSARS